MNTASSQELLDARKELRYWLKHWVVFALIVFLMGKLAIWKTSTSGSLPFPTWTFYVLPAVVLVSIQLKNVKRTCKQLQIFIKELAK